MLDHWNPGYHNYLYNLFDIKRRVLLGLNNFYFLRNIHGLHNLGVSAVEQQHIVAAWPSKLSASYAVVLPTTDE